MYDDKDGSNFGGGVIVGIGYVVGICCMISVNNSVIKGGIIFFVGLYKFLCFYEIIV